jgi:hypothetical protein
MSEQDKNNRGKTIEVKASEYAAEPGRYLDSDADRVIVRNDSDNSVRFLLTLRGTPDPLLDL